MIDNPYTNAEASALPQNELEARALVRTASRLNNIKEKWPVTTAELNEALDLNRKLWTILVTGATEEANPLPIEIKQNIFNLAHFIFKHTFAVMAKPSAQSLEILININMNIARGLNEQSLRRAEELEKAQAEGESQEN
ncbi:MAG: flagellar biosynthesis regulator FlaF [Alphaproteobacteria bacterium]|nr:flagellar biosynthesis regulator FlaF [Alphaproteobacteria bacterium]